MIEEPPKKHYMAWMTLAMLDFVTIIRFEDVFYPYQNQGLSVIFSWIFLLICYQLPYTLIATQLGLAYKDTEEGGLDSSIRRGTGSDVLGYATSWMYWAQTVPYLVDVSNSIIVSISWMILGNNTLGKHMSPFMFGLLTFVIILIFILCESAYKNSLDLLSLIGGIAMFAMSAMSVIFVILIIWALMHGGHIATKMEWSSFKPNFSVHYFSTTGLLIFAMSGAELAAPYVTRLKNPRKEFPKSMWMLFAMTVFMTLTETLGLAVLFDAKHIPHDFKMNGAFYAFQLLGEEAGMGKSLMYMYAIVCLLNLNGIVSPYKTSVVFLAFLAFGYRHKTFAKDDFVFIRNNKGALAVGWWCFIFTFICATMGFLPQDVTFESPQWTKQLWMNIITVIVLFGTGFLLPWLRKLELKHQAKANS
ncbi:amino acid permease [Lactobacillus delbrueckii subsp. bulgaricus]|nr:amino acid permease [Lactobacillus delbrueckii subsp. bulgaricus]